MVLRIENFEVLGEQSRVPVVESAFGYCVGVACDMIVREEEHCYCGEMCGARRC